MGLRDRLRIERIKQGLELPRSIKALVEVEKVANERARNATLVRTKCQDITNFTEIKTCVRIMGMLSNPQMPSNVVAEKTKEGMHQVVAKLKKAGETSDTIYKFYWDIPEFRQLWEKLGLAEEDWLEMAEFENSQR